MEAGSGVTVYDDSLEGAARFALAVLGADIEAPDGTHENAAKLRWTAYKKLETALACDSADERDVPPVVTDEGPQIVGDDFDAPICREKGDNRWLTR